jgi:hypothetical protein
VQTGGRVASNLKTPVASTFRMRAPDLNSRGLKLAAAVPARLAVAPLRELPLGVRGPAYERVRDQAMSWQLIAGRANFWEMFARDAHENVAYALAGQMASTGEQLGLAYAAGVEVALWRETTDYPGDAEVAVEMGMRAMAEAQSLFVIGTGHALANVTARALSLRQGLKAKLTAAFANPKDARSVSTINPFSDEHGDWLSLNRDTCNKLRRIAKQYGSSEIIDLVELVVHYGRGQVWGRLVARRSEDFHRWRPQSHGIQGVAKKSPWVYDGNSRCIGLGAPAYVEAMGLAEEVLSSPTGPCATSQQPWKVSWRPGRVQVMNSACPYTQTLDPAKQGGNAA